MSDAPDVLASSPEARYSDSLGKYILIYLCILALAAVQFVLAYSHTGTSGRFERMFLVALAEAGLALLFFMHLWAEKRGFLLFVLVFTGFVLAAMQYGWSDSYRMERGVPGAQPQIGVVR